MLKVCKKNEMFDNKYVLLILYCFCLSFSREVKFNNNLEYSAEFQRNQFYDDFSTHAHFETRKTLGRLEFISFLKETGKLDKDIHHHLLGCNQAEEFKYYPSVIFPEIKTCDTSNPITCAFEGIDYESN